MGQIPTSTRVGIREEAEDKETDELLMHQERHKLTSTAPNILDHHKNSLFDSGSDSLSFD